MNLRSSHSIACALVSLSLLVVAACGSSGTGAVGIDDVDRLTAQLEGGRCAFHTDPTEEQIDNSCKRHGWNRWGVRLTSGRHTCAKWAAECLAQLGDAARPAVDALIAALADGPGNYDTGDGIIPTRDAIARALGRIGDPRAVGPLLEALHDPRPVEVGPGAVGYASREPVGEVAALEALGLLGPEAVAAVPEILGILVLPIETARDEWRFRAAADALAGIGEPSAIPALVEQLDDARRREAAARALGAFGSRAVDAGPALVALVERSPDTEGNEIVRRAVGEILGQEEARRLPPNYDVQLGVLWRRVAEATKRRGCPRRGLYIDSGQERFRSELDDGMQLRVIFDRQGWIDGRRVSGRITPIQDGAPDVDRSFDSFEAFEVALESLLAEHC